MPIYLDQQSFNEVINHPYAQVNDDGVFLKGEVYKLRSEPEGQVHDDIDKLRKIITYLMVELAQVTTEDGSIAGHKEGVQRSWLDHVALDFVVDIRYADYGNEYELEICATPGDVSPT